jgi:hypothetical protein
MKSINFKAVTLVIVLLSSTVIIQSQTVKQIGKDLYYIEKWYHMGKLDSNSVYKNMNLYNIPYDIRIKLSDSSWMDTAILFFPIRFTFGDVPSVDDTIYAGRFSRALGLIHEPKIYNNANLVCSDIFRLAFFNFTSPEIYKIEKNENAIKLFYKILNGHFLLFPGTTMINDSININYKEWKRIRRLFNRYLSNINYQRVVIIPDLILESRQNGNYQYLLTDRTDNINYKDIAILLDYLRDLVEERCLKTNKLEQAEALKKILSIGNNSDY